MKQRLRLTLRRHVDLQTRSLPYHLRPQSNKDRSSTISEPQNMKKQYDFSKAQRAKFYRAGAKLNLPVYLEPQVHAWLTAVARKKHKEVSTLVNQLLRKEQELVETVS